MSGAGWSPNEGTASVQSALAAVIEQTGKTSLRVLVRDAVGLVERHYIDAALQLAEGNRTAAAELLGLSRQGFYKKLAQYEMEGYARTIGRRRSIDKITGDRLADACGFNASFR